MLLRRMDWALCAAALLLASACSTANLTAGGGGVRVASEAEIAGCDRVGMAAAQTTQRVIGFSRSDIRIREELLTLGRNQAADLGGNTVVPGSDISGGRQAFDVYTCTADVGAGVH